MTGLGCESLNFPSKHNVFTVQPGIIRRSTLVYHSAVEAPIQSNCAWHTHTCILHKCDRWGGMG